MSAAEPVNRYGPLRWMIRIAGAVLLLALVVTALYVGAGRYLITQVGVYEADVEALLTERLGRNVEIDDLSGDWVGFDPVIVVDGLAVGEPGAPDASLQRLRIRLATVSSLMRGRLVFSEFSANHADITMTQDTEGGVGLAGLWQPPAEEAQGLELLEAAAEDFDHSFSDWVRGLGRILADPVVHVSDLRVRVQTPGANEQRYQIPSIELSFQQGVFSAAGRLIGVDTAETVAWFTLEGKHFFRGGFDGTVFLDIRSERLFDAFLSRYEWFEIGLEGLNLRTSTWLTFENGQVSRLLSRLETPYLQLRSASETLSPIQDLDVTLTARRLDAPCAEPNPCNPAWELQAHNLRYRWLDEQVGPLNMSWENDVDSWRLAIDTVPLDNVVRFIRALEVMPDWASQYLHGYRPRGELRQMVFEYPQSGEYRLTAALRQAAVDAAWGAPVVEGLDGWVEHSPNGGRVRYDSRNTVFGFPDLFAAAWPFQRLSGEVTWRWQNPGWRVSGDDLRFQYREDVFLNGGFDLLLSPVETNTLGLQVGISGANHEQIAQFVPLGAVGEPLYDWLTGAIKEGEIPWGWYYGSGPIQQTAPSGSTVSEAPTDERAETETETETKVGQDRFTSAMVFDFDDVVFRYAESWPELGNGAGQFRYHGGEGWVDLDRASVGGITLQPSRIQVDTLGEETRVDIDLKAPVTGQDLNYWLEKSPLGELMGNPGDTVQVDGTADLALKVSVYPTAGSETATEVDLILSAAGLEIEHLASGLEWTDLFGEIRYSTRSGLAANGLQGQFMGRDAHFELSGGVGGASVQVHQWGHADVDAIARRWLKEPLPWVTGEFDYDLRASFGGGTENAPESPIVGFRIALDQVAVDFPAPLGKAAGTPGVLHGNLVVEAGERMRLHGALLNGPQPQQLGYQALWVHGELDAASIRLGSESAELVEGMYFIGGKIAQLDLDQWSGKLQNLGGGGEDNAAGDALAGLSLPVKLDLVAQQLAIGGIELGRVALAATNAGGGWQVEAQGKQLSGTALFPQSGPYQIELDHFALPVRQGEQDATPDLAPEQARLYPDVDVSIQELWLGDNNYGRWRFRLRSSQESLDLRDLEAETGSLIFSGNMSWQFGDSGPGRTRLIGDLKGGSIRDLNAWVQGGVPLVSDSTNAHVDLNWPGSPQKFDLSGAEGGLALSLEDGRILDQNNAAQVFRVFGVLNADTLLRRLRLDFSDLYKPGVSFEALSGTAVIDNGVLTLDPELQLAGPSGAFRLTGQTHLIDESLDMRLVVVLPLTQNLPMAALLLGAAAPVGGALFIIDKLLGDPLSKLTSATYDVSGSWKQPQIKLRSIFDTGSPGKENKAPDQRVDGPDT
ncbi:MAG: hypothetical protein CL583_05960 [Alteromonadaceae bacterium]|nr:hypothetical protein [Alteromonadaceae bacterium]